MMSIYTCQYSPAFNANPIEMNLYRIKNLSEQFVLFNDDTFVISDTVAEDFLLMKDLVNKRY